MRTAALLALLTLGALPIPAHAQSALSVYEAGKRAYDAKRYGEALAKFDEAASLEPTTARWQYNRGLALKKLRRDDDAIQAFLRSRDLDPEYKRPEIDKKLSELGWSPTPEAAAGGVPQVSYETIDDGHSTDRILSTIFGSIPVLFFVGLVGFFIYGVTRATKQMNAMKPEVLRERAESLGPRMAAIERKLAGNEDPQAQAALDRAVSAVRDARGRLDNLARRKPVKIAASLAEAEGAVAEAEKSLAGIPEEAELPRVGCYFCAKPLPNPDQRFALTLSQAGQQVPALACYDCSQMAQNGQPPRVTAVVRDGQVKHWAEVPEYDPYLNRHVPFPGATTVGLHKLEDPSRFSELASMAAGGALAAGVGVAAAVVASKLVDLDALRSSAASTAASKAVAEGAVRDDSSSWRDQS